MIFKKKQDAAVQQTAAGEAKPAAKGGKAAAFFRKNWKWISGNSQTNISTHC